MAPVAGSGRRRDGAGSVLGTPGTFGTAGGSGTLGGTGTLGAPGRVVARTMRGDGPVPSPAGRSGGRAAARAVERSGQRSWAFGTTAETRKLITAMMRAASSAHQNPPMMRMPQSVCSVIHAVSMSMSALTTSENSPSVRM